jgi:hypothetical protein
MQVVTIEEDNHGQIGIAMTYADAVHLLVNQNWLDENFEVWVDNEDYLTQTIKEKLGDEWFTVILEWTLEQFNEFFEGYFYLTIEEVYEVN